jgi:hypothetical protein
MGIEPTSEAWETNLKARKHNRETPCGRCRARRNLFQIALLLRKDFFRSSSLASPYKRDFATSTGLTNEGSIARSARAEATKTSKPTRLTKATIRAITPPREKFAARLRPRDDLFGFRIPVAAAV